MTAPVANPLVERVVAVLARQPAGLLTDIDGTISRIAPTPDAATVDPAVAADLARLAGKLAVVAAITGRAATDAARLIGVPRLLYIGNHGLEWRLPATSATPAQTIVEPAAVPYVALLAETLAEVERAVAAAGLSGILIENKGVTASIHYRLAPDPVAARVALLPIARALATAHGFRLTEGRLVLELRPPVRISKGTALKALVERHRLAGVVFFGDDVTDLDAMAELRRLREAGQLAGLNVGVAVPESPPELHQLADLLVDRVDRATALLAAVADRLTASDPAPA